MLGNARKVAQNCCAFCCAVVRCYYTKEKGAARDAIGMHKEAAGIFGREARELDGARGNDFRVDGESDRREPM